MINKDHLLIHEIRSRRDKKIEEKRLKTLAAKSRVNEERRLAAAASELDQKKRRELNRTLKLCFKEAYQGATHISLKLENDVWKYRNSLRAIGLNCEKYINPLWREIKRLQKEYTHCSTLMSKCKVELVAHSKKDPLAEADYSRELSALNISSSLVVVGAEPELHQLEQMSLSDIRVEYGLEDWSNERLLAFRRGRLAALKAGAQEMTALVNPRAARDHALAKQEIISRAARDHELAKQEISERLKVFKNRLESINKELIGCKKKLQMEGPLFLKISWAKRSVGKKQAETIGNETQKLRWFSIGDGRAIFNQIFLRAKRYAEESKIEIRFAVISTELSNLWSGREVFKIPFFITLKDLVARLKTEGFNVSLLKTDQKIVTLLIEW